MEFSHKVDSDKLPNIDYNVLMQNLVKVNEDVIATVVLYLKEKFAEPKHGETYEIAPGVFYTASAPGEYPANKFGILSNSLEMSNTEVSNGTVQTNLSTEVDYAWDLEGTEVDTQVTRKGDLKHVSYGRPHKDNEGKSIRPWMTKVLAESFLPEVVQWRLQSAFQKMLDGMES